MVTVVLAWCVFFLTVTGAGCLTTLGVSRLTHGRTGCSLGVFQTFWIGLAAVVAFTQLWSLRLPVNGLCLAVVLVLSAMGLPAFARLVRARGAACCPAQPRDWIRMGLLAAGAIAAVGLGARGLATHSWSGAYDTELYHFSWIRWANEYPAVPGLANLHSRLATPSGFLLFSALIDNLWWDRSSAWLTNGFLVTLAAVHWLAMILAPARDLPLRARILSLLTLPYVLRLLVGLRPALYFDGITLLTQMLLLIELLRFQPLVSRKKEADPHDLATAVLVLLSLAVLGFCFKPIGAMSLLFVGGLSAGILWRVASSGRSGAISAAAAAFIPGLVLVGYFARNAILSGWLLYPAPAGKLNVAWALPRHPLGITHDHEMQSVEGQYTVNKAWARVPGPEYRRAVREGASFWFPRWRERVWRGSTPRLLYIGAFLVAVHLVIAMAQKKLGHPLGWDGFLIGLAGANILFWFWGVPDLRFGDAFFRLWFALGFALLFSSPVLTGRSRALLCAVAFAFMVNVEPWRFATNRQPSMWGVGKAEPQPTKLVTLSNGQTPPLTVRVPETGDQCGDTALPCTPYPLNELRERKPGNFRYGFFLVLPGL